MGQFPAFDFHIPCYIGFGRSLHDWPFGREDSVDRIQDVSRIRYLPYPAVVFQTFEWDEAVRRYAAAGEPVGHMKKFNLVDIVMLHNESGKNIIMIDEKHDGEHLVYAETHKEDLAGIYDLWKSQVHMICYRKRIGDSLERTIQS